jgi:hypothetical protein
VIGASRPLALLPRCRSLLLGRCHDLLASVRELVVLLGQAGDDASTARHGTLAEFVKIVFAGCALFGGQLLGNRGRRNEQNDRNQSLAQHFGVLHYKCGRILSR